MALESLFERRAVRDPAWNAWASGGEGPGGGNTNAGELVTTGSALQLLAVYSAVSFIADTIGQLPIDQYRKVGGERREVFPRAAWLDQPNPDLDGQDFITQFIASLLINGNSYTAVLRNRNGEVAELYPLHPDDVRIEREDPGRPLAYYLSGQRYSGEIMHRKAFSLPGQVIGANPIGFAREAIGAGLAQQKFGARFYSNGTVPGIVIETPQGPEVVDAERLKEGVEKFHRGSAAAHRALVLTGGASAKTLAISPADAQFLEGRNFTAAEIATGVYRIPPDVLGYALQGSKDITYQNLESRWTELRRRCFGTWITKYERAMFSLLPRPQYVRLNDDAYMRADMRTRYDSYKVGLEAGFLTVDEVRALEDLAPLPEQPVLPA
jgi:HK97 family phage portal protein